MAVQVNINDITGSTPYQVFICQTGNTGCFFVSEITDNDLRYVFDIPASYNNSDSYLFKVIDNFGCIISGQTTV